MEPLNQDFHQQLVASWGAMGEGAPMLAALAGLCARAVVDGPGVVGALSIEEQAILYAARDRGVLEVRGVPSGFEAPLRFLAVYVEIDEHERFEFRNRSLPQITIRFFEAFANLCRRGLILHHLHHDFSLSQRGFELAKTIPAGAVSDALESLDQR